MMIIINYRAKIYFVWTLQDEGVKVSQPDWKTRMTKIENSNQHQQARMLIRRNRRKVFLYHHYVSSLCRWPKQHVTSTNQSTWYNYLSNGIFWFLWRKFICPQKWHSKFTTKTTKTVNKAKKRFFLVNFWNNKVQNQM